MPIEKEVMDIHINVKNFGPIEKAEIDLRPLTVFVGESNTGKTYLAALIYALHQHFDGVSQFPWADSIASYFSFAYRSRDRYLQSDKEELEQEMLEVFEKLNTTGRPFKFSDLPQRMSDLFLCSQSHDSQIRKTSQTNSNGVSTLNLFPN